MKFTHTMASLSLVLGAVLLFSVQGPSAQTAKSSPLKPGTSRFAALAGANTGCGYSTGEVPFAPVPPRRKSRPDNGASGGARLLLVAAPGPEEDSDRSGIVGLWSIQFVSEGTTGIPDGAIIDQGYATWHSDGTEIMNSGRPPITGSFCMGVWERIHRSTYKLNHFALSWDPTGTVLVGPANIKEEVVLAKGGDSYSGTFTIDQFDTHGNVLAHITGTVTGTRITVD